MMESIYEKIVGLIKTGIVVLEENGRVVTWNSWMAQRSGIKETDIRGQAILEAIPELKKSRIERAIHKALQFNCPSILSAKLIDASFPLYRELIIGASEPERLVQSILIKPFFIEGAGQHCVISIFDISSADLRERALRNQTTMLNNLVGEIKEKDYEFKTLFQNTQNGILIFDQSGGILNANPAALKTLGLCNDQVDEVKIFNLIDDLNEGDFDSESSESNIYKKLPIDGDEIEMVANHTSGNRIQVSVSANIIPHQDQPTRFFIFIRDITEKKRTEDRLYRLAKFDPLTGLYNRASFIDILERSLSAHQQTNTRLSIFFIDLDRFKSVNDKLGHDAGDTLLKLVGERLTESCRARDVIARWSGDEFVILLEQQEKRSTITVAEKILDSFNRHFLVKHQEVYTGCSIGISQYPEDGADADTLISNADQAMYQAKSQGKGVFRFFTQSMNRKMLEHLQIESELRVALKEQQFVMYFQPQVSVLNGELAGVEALIRWNHPEKGIVPPTTFISVAEDCGLISKIGDWVMQNTIEMAAKWKIHEGNPLPMSINLSAKQFTDDNLVTKLTQLMSAVDIPPSSIILEITENHLVGDTEHNLTILSALKATGVKIAIDDFGTGYSSLAYLRTLPVDIIKIDRAFLIDACVNKTSAHIVSAIIELAHALELEVVAEGIEDEEQLTLLKQEGCDIAQGFLVAKPMSVETLQDWFHNRKNGTNS